METKLLSKQITSFSFHLNPDMKQVKAEIGTKVQYGTPKTDEDHSAILLVQIDVHADNPDDFHVFLEEQIVFAFDAKPADYINVLNELFQTTGIALVSDDFDKALEGIGKPPIRFKDQFNTTNNAV